MISHDIWRDLMISRSCVSYSQNLDLWRIVFETFFFIGNWAGAWKTITFFKKTITFAHQNLKNENTLKYTLQELMIWSYTKYWPRPVWPDTMTCPRTTSRRWSLAAAGCRPATSSETAWCGAVPCNADDSIEPGDRSETTSGISGIYMDLYLWDVWCYYDMWKSSWLFVPCMFQGSVCSWPVIMRAVGIKSQITLRFFSKWRSKHLNQC